MPDSVRGCQIRRILCNTPSIRKLRMLALPPLFRSTRTTYGSIASVVNSRWLHLAQDVTRLKRYGFLAFRDQVFSTLLLSALLASSQKAPHYDLVRDTVGQEASRGSLLTPPLCTGPSKRTYSTSRKVFDHTKISKKNDNYSLYS